VINQGYGILFNKAFYNKYLVRIPLFDPTILDFKIVVKGKLIIT